MLQQLINHSSDIKGLWDEGYEIEFRDSHLLVHHVPYLNSNKEIKYGTLVSTLTLAGNKTVAPDTHVAYFIGEVPCHNDGNPISSIIISSNDQKLSENLIINSTFSSKPQTGWYIDYFEKMTTYVAILSGPAMSLDDSIILKTFKIVESQDPESVFNYPDTNSSKNEINIISAKLKNLKIAIIGLGGTGSYILDLVAKTQVKEIHLYDADWFLQHNAFRAPGAPPIEKLRERYKKADYFKELYSSMHKNIFSHTEYIGADNVEKLSEIDFVFVCIDKNEVKKLLLKYFGEKKTSFIDVGMGIEKVDDQLIGIIRVTTSTENKRDHVLSKDRIPLSDREDAEYSKNIQIADLNALNAALAVIKWKKLYGFYQDFEKENFTTYSINVSQLLNEDFDT
jgi:hypothetical protein